jgi:hypothetical protein
LNRTTVAVLLAGAFGGGCVGGVFLPAAPFVALDGSIRSGQGEANQRVYDVWDLSTALPDATGAHGIRELGRRIEEGAPATRGRLTIRDSGTLSLRRSPAAEAQMDAWLAAERRRLGLPQPEARSGP